MKIQLTSAIDPRHQDGQVACLSRAYKRDFQIPAFIAIALLAVLFAGSLLASQPGIETLQALFASVLAAMALLAAFLWRTLRKLPDVLFKVGEEGLVFPVGSFMRWRHSYAVVPFGVINDVDAAPDGGHWKIRFLLETDADPAFNPLFGEIGKHWRSPGIAVIEFPVGSRKHAERMLDQVKHRLGSTKGDLKPIDRQQSR